MPRICLLIVALAASCTPEPSRAQLRQPLPVTPALPLAIGRVQGALLGSSLGACRLDGFVAGAPGDNSVLFVTDAGVWLEAPIADVDAGSFAVAVACDGTAIVPRVVTAGDLGTWSSAAIGWNLVDGVAAEAVEAGPLATTPLLSGSPRTSSVSLQQPGPGGYSNIANVFPGAAAGAALVWDRIGTSFVVGAPETATIYFYSWDGNEASPVATLQGPAGSRFGAALAIGDVHPHAGAELIVGAPGTPRVFIYGAALPPQLLMVLDAVDPISGSFGISLAIEPYAAGSLGALWVGDPLNDQVVRFVGDAGEPVPVDPDNAGSYFGFSLAVKPRALIVGAPFYSDLEQNTGAVFSLPFDPTTLLGTTQKCDLFAPCTTLTCETGRCVGGVVCVPTGALLCDVARCRGGFCEPEIDSGIPMPIDAGIQQDAGIDAGTPDAGAQPLPDAGSAMDGGIGVLTFGTCGCSGPGAVPLVLLCLVLSRRTRRR